MKISELNGLLKPEKEDYILIVDNSEKETKKASMSALLDLFYPVGSYYVTSDASFNPNESWGGTWNLDNDNPDENRYDANLQGHNDAPDGDDPISLIQPSKIVNRWHREA